MNMKASKKSNKLTAYVGPFPFPSGAASSRRVMGIADALRSGNNEVIICAEQPKDSNTSTLAKLSDYNVSYLNKAPSNSNLRKGFEMFRSGTNALRWLNALRNQPDVVIDYGGYAIYDAYLIPWCRKNKIPLIIDAVEWYDPTHVPLGAWGPFRWNSELAIRFFHICAGNIIAISSYLERYYQSKGCRTIRIPPTLDTKKISYRLEPSHLKKPVILAYTGFPGKKDLLNNVIAALLQIDPHGQNIQLVVAGPKPQEVLQLPVFSNSIYKDLPGCIEALGNLPFEETLNVVRDADFTVLLRPPLRYAQAGFPTKVPESLAVGTPVICNITSDLGDYIRDGWEGLICRNESVTACIEAIERAILLTPAQKESMRKAARAQAERSFDFRNYSEALDRFIKEAVKI
jgi:glycosyltransferase involved in cell wall biosynthesis